MQREREIERERDKSGKTIWSGKCICHNGRQREGGKEREKERGGERKKESKKDGEINIACFREKRER